MTRTPGPLVQVSEWLEAARGAGENQPGAVILATASAEGPSARVVSVKEINDRGLVFTTTMYSLKARQLAADPRVEVVFWWPHARRQIRVRGEVQQLDGLSAERLFAARPREHQLQTRVSHQGEPIGDLAHLRAALARADRQYRDKPVTRPDDWGAMRVHPTAIEFWEEAVDRLHDRLLYERDGNGWHTTRLAP